MTKSFMLLLGRHESILVRGGGASGVLGIIFVSSIFSFVFTSPTDCLFPKQNE